MRLPQARAGQPVKIRSRQVDFSLWPMRRVKTGATLNTRLFVADPWPIMAQAVGGLRTKDERQAGARLPGASRGLLPRRPFSEHDRCQTAAPVLRFPQYRKSPHSRQAAAHPTRQRASRSCREIEAWRERLLDAFLEASPTTDRPKVFDLLMRALTGSGLPAVSQVDVLTLMRQIVTGHRLFVSPTGKGSESFLAPKRIAILHDPNTYQIWLQMSIVPGDLARLGLSQTKLLNSGGLAPAWRVVSSGASDAQREVLLEMHTPITYYQSWIADSIIPLVDTLRRQLWQTVLSVPPYRAYYLFVPPPAELPCVFPQILSAYALTYYFGSITRYRPHHFDRILRGSYGAFTEEFLHDQPLQLLFLFASEFVQREVSKAALV